LSEIGKGVLKQMRNFEATGQKLISFMFNSLKNIVSICKILWK